VLVPEVVERSGVKIGRFEVTRVQYAQFDKTYKIEAGKENYPAAGFTFDQAKAYCDWLSRVTKQTWRLPNEGEAGKLYGEPSASENTLDYWAGYPVNPDDVGRLREKVKEFGGAATLLKEVGSFKGEGDEVWEPRFTFHGFRYVELSGYPGEVTHDTITGVVLHSEMAPTGEFECSDPLLNQLQNNIVWGQKGNFVDVPTDCPQRDERQGWTGDIQVFVRTAAFNLNIASFMTKWMQDVADSQSGQGCIPPWC
jgi:hypothetical protein